MKTRVVSIGLLSQFNSDDPATGNGDVNNHTSYRVFSHDVTAGILVSQNNETAAMLVSQP